MSSHPRAATIVTNLEDPDDLLLSYLNADCLDTTTMDTVKSPSPASSSSSYDTSLSPLSNDTCSWSSMPFLDAHSFACIGSSDMMTAGIAPCALSHEESLFSASSISVSALLSSSLSGMTSLSSPSPGLSLVPPLFDTIGRSSSPTLSSLTVSSTVSSSSDTDEPKRKRERKRPAGNTRRNISSSSQTQPTTHTCKPILPAASTATAAPISSSSYVLNRDQQPVSLMTVKSEPRDLDTSILMNIDNSNTNHTGRSSEQYQQQQQQQQHEKRNGSKQKPSAIDAHNKRQERLIKNRAAALLSRKRKREHLHSLEKERHCLSKDNDMLKSKMVALEARLQQLEEDYQHQQQQCLLLQQQNHRYVLAYGSPSQRESSHSPIFSSLTDTSDPLSTKVTALPVTSKKSSLLHEDKKSSSLNNKSRLSDPMRQLMSLQQGKGDDTMGSPSQGNISYDGGISDANHKTSDHIDVETRTIHQEKGEKEEMVLGKRKVMQ